MRWLKRSLWIAAWSFWAWTGWRLLLELPRGSGLPVAAVPALDVAPEAGFLADTNRFALVRRHGARGGVVETYDAESGALLAATLAPGMGDLLWPDCLLDGRGVLLAKALPNEDGTQSTPGLHVLDLRAGRWRRVTTQTVHAGAPHPSKPWAVLVEEDAAPPRSRRVVVADWESGQTAAVRQLAPGEELAGRVFFVSDGDRVAVPIKPAGGPGPDIAALEVWRAGEPPTLEKTLRDVPVAMFQPPASAAGGRVAFADPPGTPMVYVYDVDAGRRVFADPAREGGGSSADPLGERAAGARRRPGRASRR